MKKAMLVGVIVSVVIVLGLVLTLFLAHSEPPPAPRTSATTPELLAKFDLPATLPPVYKSTNPDADANESYRKLIELAVANRGQMQINTKGIVIAEKLSNLLIDGMNAGKIDRIYFDAEIPFRAGGRIAFLTDIDNIRFFIGKHAQEYYAIKENQRATEELQALFALGHRCFTKGQRLAVRYIGLVTMKQVAEVLAGHQDSMPPGMNAQPWLAEIKRIQEAWDKKKDVVSATPPQLLDLIALAEEDKDTTFRVEATLWMGIAKFFVKLDSHRDLLIAAIEKLKKDADPAVAAAAKVAAEFTKADLAELQK